MRFSIRHSLSSVLKDSTTVDKPATPTQATVSGSLPTIDFRKEDLSPYILRGRTEILALLNTIAEQNLLTTVSFVSGPDAVSEFFVGSILEVDEHDNQLILDPAQNPAINLAVTRAQNIKLETLLDKIRISFTLEALQFCMHEGRHALRASIPDRMVRLQRREHFRVPIPVMHPVECTITLDQPDGAVALTLKPADLSFGGMGLFDDQVRLNSTVGHHYKNCRINLPGVGVIFADLQVTNAQQVSLPGGQTRHRIGLGFLKLSNATGTLLQRYILSLERNRNASHSGLGWNPGHSHIHTIHRDSDF